MKADFRVPIAPSAQGPGLLIGLSLGSSFDKGNMLPLSVALAAMYLQRVTEGLEEVRQTAWLPQQSPPGHS